MRKLTIFLLHLVIANTPVVSATYYLDAVNGNDSDAGTTLAPWKTMDRAMENYGGGGDVVAKGDTIYLRDGSYGDVEFLYTPSPLPSSWSDKIAYIAENGETPVFTQLDFYGYYGRYLEFYGINVIEENADSDSYLVRIRGTCSLRLINLTVRGYWPEAEPFAKLGGLTSTGINISSPGGKTVNDILIDNCDVSHVIRGIYYFNTIIVGGECIIRNNNVYETTNSGIYVGASGTGATVVIEDNYVYDQVRAVEWYVATGDITEAFAQNEECTQETTGATGIYYLAGATHRFNPDTADPLVAFEDGYTINGALGGVMENPTIVGDPHLTHGSSIGLQSICNVEIKKNIIRAHGATAAIGLYGVAGTGHENILIENNLVYDYRTGTPVVLYAIGSDEGNTFVFRNNTIIGSHGGGVDGWYYGNVCLFYPYPGKNGTNFKIYNNIFVGAVVFQKQGESFLTEFVEDNNLIYSSVWWANGGGPWVSELKGANTIIFAPGPTPVQSEVFESGFFVDPNYTEEHGEVCDFQLLVDANAVDFGDANNAPTLDLLGSERDANPDAGCYEYGASAPATQYLIANLIRRFRKWTKKSI